MRKKVEIFVVGKKNSKLLSSLKEDSFWLIYLGLMGS